MILELDIALKIDLNALPDRVWAGLTAEMNDWFAGQDGTSMHLCLEPFVGGRWFRDLSDQGQGVGYLWGHVQVFKPGRLLELIGPMAMSHPCVNHIAFRLTPNDTGTTLELSHRGIGYFPKGVAEAFTQGWNELLNSAFKNHIEN